jgi:NAD-dependent deacetylase
VCPSCGLAARPHVLWFDEFYEEENYRILSAQRAVAHASLCFTVGTSGGVPLAGRLAGIAGRAGATLIDVNTHDNKLRQLSVGRGGFVEGPAADAMPGVVRAIAALVVNG